MDPGCVSKAWTCRLRPGARLGLPERDGGVGYVAVAGQACSPAIGDCCGGSERGSAREDVWEGEGPLVVK
jgi:hypothetical protein